VALFGWTMGHPGKQPSSGSSRTPQAPVTATAAMRSSTALATSGSLIFLALKPKLGTRTTPTTPPMNSFTRWWLPKETKPFMTLTVDLGPNQSAGQTPPVDQIIYNPAIFGYGPGDGPGTGPNNGNCAPDFNYPLTSPANPGAEYLVAAGKTCVAPVAGWATITVTTALGAPEYTKVTGPGCTSNGVASPCYTGSGAGNMRFHKHGTFSWSKHFRV